MTSERTTVRLTVLVTLAALAGAPSDAEGQAQLGTDVSLMTRHVWHGLTRTTLPSGQGQLFLALSRKGALFAIGARANVEPFRARANDLSDHRSGHGGIGEVDLWSEGSARFSGGDATLGIDLPLRRADHTAAGSLSTFNTVELYARLRQTSLYLAPSVEASWDIDKVQGLYLEPALHLPLLGNPEGLPFWALYLTVSAGLNLGQRPKESSTQRFYFAGNGLTHVDIGAGFTIAPFLNLKSVDAMIDLHVQFNHDPETRRTRLTGSSGRTLRAGIVLSYPGYSGRSP